MNCDSCEKALSYEEVGSSVWIPGTESTSEYMAERCFSCCEIHGVIEMAIGYHYHPFLEKKPSDSQKEGEKMKPPDAYRLSGYTDRIYYMVLCEDLINSAALGGSSITDSSVQSLATEIIFKRLFKEQYGEEFSDSNMNPLLLQKTRMHKLAMADLRDKFSVEPIWFSKLPLSKDAK